MNDNPYASFTESSMDAPVVSLKIAGRGRRFANLLIDGIITQILAGIAGIVFGLAFVAGRANSGGLSASDESLVSVLGGALGIAVWFAYYFACEAVFQRTFGKILTGTKVVSEMGTPASLPQLLGRSLARLIPFEALSFLIGNEAVGWHDSLSGTRVIETR